MQGYKKLAALALLALAGAAHATTQGLGALGTWSAFDVDSTAAADAGLGWIDLDGRPLSFTFQATGPVRLTVVDGGFAGDQFDLRLNGRALGLTSAVASSYPDSVGLDFDAALASHRYSSATVVLGAGHYTLSGSLARSALDADGLALDATVGGVMLSAVPEPAAAALLLCGMFAFGALSRRRQ